MYNTQNSNIPSNLVRTIAIDVDGSKWISSFDGDVSHFDGTNWSNYNANNSPITGRVSTITITPSGVKWFGIGGLGQAGGGVVKLENTSWKNYDTQSTSVLPSGGPSSYTVKVKVIDNGGITTTGRIQLETVATTTINVLNLTVNGGGPYEVNEGGTILLNATSNNPTGGTMIYSWDLDNNGIYEKIGQSTTYSVGNSDGPKQKTINVKVVDSVGAYAIESVLVNVNNVSPTAIFENTADVIDEGSSDVLTFSNQYDPSIDDTQAGFQYSFDCTNDGVYEALNQTEPIFQCTYPNVGNFKAKGKIMDKDSGYTDYLVNIIVKDIPSLGEFVVLGKEGVYIKQNAIINGGDVGTNNVSIGPFLDSGVETSIGDSVSIANSESDVYGDSIKLKTNSQVNNVYYNDVSGAGSVLGNSTSPLPLPLINSFPPAPNVAPGNVNVNVLANSTQTLSGGSYGDLVVNHDATLLLTGGIYNFNSWDIRDDANIAVSADSEIRIAGRLNTNARVIIAPDSSANIDASKIKIIITGKNGVNGNIGSSPKAAEFGRFNIIKANVYVSNGTLWVKDHSSVTGALFGNWVIIGENTELYFDSAY